MPKGHPLLVLDLLGESQARLHHLQRSCVFPSRSQVLPQGEKGVDFGRTLTNLTSDLEGLFPKAQSVAVTDRA